MARQKQAIPLRREPSDFENLNGHSSDANKRKVEQKPSNGLLEKPQSLSEAALTHVIEDQPAGLLQLLICVGGIYASL